MLEEVITAHKEKKEVVTNRVEGGVDTNVHAGRVRVNIKGDTKSKKYRGKETPGEYEKCRMVKVKARQKKSRKRSEDADCPPPPKRCTTTDDDTDSDVLDQRRRFIAPQVELIDQPEERFNDIVREKVIRLSPGDIDRLKRGPVTEGMLKIFVGEFRKAFGHNALHDHLEPDQLDMLRSKDLCGVIDLFLDKWSCVFRQIRGCNSDTKKQLQEILSTLKTERELIDLEWLFYVRNILFLFRGDHPLNAELGMIEAVFEGRPVNIPDSVVITPPEQQQPLPTQRRYPQPPIGTPPPNRMTLLPPLAPMNILGVRSPIRPPFMMSQNPFHFHHQSMPFQFNSSPRIKAPTRPLFEMVPPVIAAPAAPPSPQIDTVSSAEITPVSPILANSQCNVNPLDKITDSTPKVDEMETPKSPERLVRCKANINPMDMIDTHSESNSSSFSRSSATRNSGKGRKPRKKEEEPINPGLLARITSDN